MANTETPILQRIQVAMSRAGARVFRNNVGTVVIAKSECSYCRVKHPQRISFGLCEGSPDLVGWQSMVVTPEMVGRKVAVFVGVEVKVPGETAKDLQKQWQESLKDAGAIAFVAHSQEEAVELLKQEVS